jgi:hypothetical protein
VCEDGSWGWGSWTFSFLIFVLLFSSFVCHSLLEYGGKWGTIYGFHGWPTLLQCRAQTFGWGRVDRKLGVYYTKVYDHFWLLKGLIIPSELLSRTRLLVQGQSALCTLYHFYP